MTFSLLKKTLNPVGNPHDTSVSGLRRVLVVDDEPRICRLVERFLGPKWITITASDANQAVKLLSKSRFHTVITDYDMPGHNGIWLLRWVQKAYPNTRRILYSGNRVPGIVSHLSSNLIQHFIIKPASQVDFQALFNPNDNT